MNQAILWAFLISTLSTAHDTNLATNTNIILLLLLGLSNDNNFGNNFGNFGNFGNNGFLSNGFNCQRTFGNFF